MVPTRGNGRISPGNGECGIAALAAGEGEHIAAEIAAEENTVLFAQPVIRLGVQIIEIVAATADLRSIVQERFHQHIDVRAAAGYDERTAVLHDRPFQRQPRTDQPDAALPVEAFRVPFLHGDVQHRGDPSAVIGRHAALDQFDVAHRIGIENAEEAEEMAGVVHGGIVQQDQVLIGTAAAHVETTVAFAVVLHAGQELDRFQDVHFAEQCGQRRQFLHIQFHPAHFGAFGILVVALAHDLDLLHHDRGRTRIDIDHHIFRDVQLSFEVLVAEEAHHQRVFPRWNIDHVIAIDVGGGAFQRFLHIDVGPDQGFAIGSILHVAADGECLCEQHRGRTRKDREKKGPEGSHALVQSYRAA